MKTIFQILIVVVGCLCWAVPFALAETGTFSAPEDSYVRSTSPGTNYGYESELIADGVSQDPDNGAYGEAISLLKWDLSSIPKNANVTRASITLNFINSSTGSYLMYSQNNDWSEGTVSFNDLQMGQDILARIFPSTFGRVTIPLNSEGVALVQQWVQGSTSNNGLAIASDGTNDGIAMSAKDSFGFPPTLEVDYTLPGIPGWEVVSRDYVVRASNRVNVTLDCPVGKVLAGGGYISNDASLEFFASGPNVDGTGWTVGALNSFTTSSNFTTRIICVDSN